MDQQQQSRWRPTRRQLLWAGVAVVLLTIAIRIGYRYDITLWDWIKLLIVPAVIAGGGLWFNAQQREREQQIASDRAQDEALQAYLDQISQLLGDKDRPLHRTQRGDRLSIIARSRTLSVLGRLDGSRKRSVLQFLYESGLIARDRAVIDLRGADLSQARLIGLDLSQADLSEASLRQADLSETNLTQADLSQADLSEASLRRADLSKANLRQTNLQHARVGSPRDTLFGESLFGAIRNKLASPLTTTVGRRRVYRFLGPNNVRVEELMGSRWSRVLWPTNLRAAELSEALLTYADLRRVTLHRANLSNAKLNGADLEDANLSEANLFGADLSQANLHWADLSQANLFWAELSGTELRVDNALYRLWMPSFWEKVARRGQVNQLTGATMPHGTIKAGQYVSTEFQPALSFNVSDGWHWLGDFETTAELFLEGPEGGQLNFTHPSGVFDPSAPSEPKETPEPPNAAKWASWFQSHPNLETSKPVPVSVGGASGMRIDVTLSSTPENYPRDLCGETPCVPLYPSSGSGISSYVDTKDRFVIVDVEGETVVIDVAAPADKFEKFLPKAQQVLDTIEWKRPIEWESQ